MLILYNVRMDMAGSVDFSAANAKSSAQLRVKGEHAPFFNHKAKFPSSFFIVMLRSAKVLLHFSIFE